jgi:hypothetical protein
LKKSIEQALFAQEVQYRLTGVEQNDYPENKKPGISPV